MASQTLIRPFAAEPGDLVIPLEAYPHAVAQSGELDHLADAPGRFAYDFDRLQRNRLATIAPFLPEAADSVLDIGGRLGAMLVLLGRHYGEGTALWLLDGADAGPKVVKHDQPFNELRHSQAFMAANGAKLTGFLACHEERHTPEEVAEFFRSIPPFDLVVSFKAWGFHVRPGLYLPMVLRSTRQGSRIVVDVRREKGFRAEFERWFEPVGVAAVATKFERLVFERL